MNWVDWVIILYMVISVIGGAVQGLIRSVLAFVGVIVGVVLAANFYQNLGGSVFKFISNVDIANVVAFVVILLVVMIIAGIVGTALRSVIRAVKLGWVDGLGGAVFGLVMGFISAGAFLAVVVKLTGSDLIAGSKLAAFMLDKFPIVLSFLPNEFDTIRSFFK